MPSAPPANPDQLRTFLRSVLNLQFPQTAVCPGHNSPFDYLAHSFFDQSDVIVWAPRGGGKTRLGAAATLLDLLYKPPAAIRILGGSLDQSLRMWEHLYPDILDLADDLLDGRASARRIRLSNGASAAVTCQSQCAVRGLRVQKLRCDEVELFKPDIWQAAQLTTRSIPAHDGSLIRATVEAFSTYHKPYGLMRDILDKSAENHTRIIKWCILEVLARCTDRDCDSCPLKTDCNGLAKTRCDGFLSIDDAIAMKRRVSFETWQSEMLCLRPILTRSVFPSFNPDLHVRQSPPTLAQSQLFLGIDFGFGSAFACLWIRKFADGTVHIIDEYVKGLTMLHQHIKEIASRPHGPILAVACDPAGAALNSHTARSDLDLLRAQGWHVYTTKSQIVDGLNLIRTGLHPALGPPTLYIHPRCTKLIQAFQCLRYPITGGELPHKDNQHDHLIDALRYFYVNANRQPPIQRRY